MKNLGVEYTMEVGGPKPYCFEQNSEYQVLILYVSIYERQTLSAKVRCQEGNSPDRPLRSLSYNLVGKEMILRTTIYLFIWIDIQEVGLEAAIL